MYINCVIDNCKADQLLNWSIIKSINLINWSINYQIILHSILNKISRLCNFRSGPYTITIASVEVNISIYC